MENVTMVRQGTKLIVTIDLTKDLGPSSTGKSLVIATTRGNAVVPGEQDTFIGVNVYRKASQA